MKFGFEVASLARGATATHSGAEGLSGPCRGRVPKRVLKVSATLCCKLPDSGVREHPPRTDDHAVAQYYVVALEVAEEPAEW